MRLAPFSGRIVRGRHIEPFIGHGKDDPKLSRVVANGGRPHAVPRLYLTEARVRQVLEGVIDDRPIDQIAGM